MVHRQRATGRTTALAIIAELALVFLGPTTPEQLWDKAIVGAGIGHDVDLAPLWFRRWLMFWMACAELFGYEKGSQWLVAHYRFVRPD